MVARRWNCLVGLGAVVLLLAGTRMDAAQGPASSQPTAEPQPQDGIETVLQAFDRHPVVAIGELHGNEQIHDFLLKLIRDDRLPAKTRTVLVEFGNARYQKVLDRYLRGDSVPASEVARVWQNTSQLMVWDSPVYERFFNAAREINRSRPSKRQLRVILADPPIKWERVQSAEAFSAAFTPHGGEEARDRYPARLLAKQVLRKRHTALVIMGVMHVLHRQSAFGSAGIVELVEKQRPGSTFVMVPHQGFPRNPPTYEPRIAAWKPGTAAGLKGTWLGELRMDVVFPWLESDESQLPRFQEMADALLYLGPVTGLTTAGARLSVYEDDAYLRELERRDRIATGGYYASILAQIRQRIMQKRMPPVSP